MGMLFCDREGSSGGNGRFFRLPGIIIRCALALSTKDGRRLEFFFDPVFTGNGSIPFCAPERGAYYGETDRLLVFDMLGLFHAAIDVPQPSGPRLLVMPRTAEQVLPLPARSGGAGLRTEPRFLRTDNLIDHRPYIPGDDPRRINWKLYGHAGEIFVREGELEPPPHSRIVILIDTQTDYSLYNAEAGRRGVDLLCENALALALDYESRGMDAGIGFSGGGVSFGGPVEMAAVLAHPAALPLSSQGRELPLPDDVQDALVLALPRDWTSGRTERPSGLAPGNTLDAFLKKREGRQKVDLLFLYDGEDAQAARLEKNAEACARFYGGKGGIRAGYIRI
jgi:hypothetical protein